MRPAGSFVGAPLLASVALVAAAAAPAAAANKEHQQMMAEIRGIIGPHS